MAHMITIKMAAEKTGFSMSYIRQLCASQKIKAKKLGHDWIMPVNAFDKIKRQRQRKDEG